jgi:NitT/TauT family transport system ATP-binding protein
MLLEIKNVSKVYGATGHGSSVQALLDVSLSVGEGEFISFVGPSGCGKSTLLRLVSGLDRPSAGEITFDGASVSAPLPAMGMTFQQPTLLPWRTVMQNVLLPFELMGIKPSERRDRANSLIQLVGLNGFEHRFPHELSGGMQQRVGICRSLVTDPKILVMDEPFAALDLLTRDEMAVELSRVSQREAVTTVFVTHSINEAVYLSDRVVVMTPRPGRVAQVLKIDAPRPRAVSIEESPLMLDAVKTIKGLIYHRNGRYT